MIPKTSENIRANRDRKLFLEKNQILEAARDKLKSEFVGLDGIIDEIVRQVSFWFIFPELQEQPYIINLWGMTGVGKTALITRLIELIGCSNMFARFDLGQNGHWSIAFGDLEKLAGYDRKIIALDEFQHARTIDENGAEVKAYGDRIIWDLLDSGTIHRFSQDHNFLEIKELHSKLLRLIKLGIKASAGKVIAGKKLFKEEIDTRHPSATDNKGDENKQEIFLIPDSMLDYFINRSFNGQNFQLNREVREFLSQFDEKQTISVLKDYIEKERGQDKIKLTNMLIFVMGNIDEAYTASDNFNSEIDADVFHRHSLNIKIHNIKHALKKRFRPEQIARLGNNHVIYPSMSQDSFKKLIELELAKISGRFFQEKKIQLEFDPSLKELIYQEGVVPTQGARPIISTMNQLIRANLGRIYAEIYSSADQINRIGLTVQNRQIVSTYHHGLNQLFTKDIPTTLFNIEKKQQQPDDKQAVTALHEAGHAIAGAILKGCLPKEINSRSSMPGSDGFTLFEGTNRDISSFARIRSEVACDLAGLAAEKIIFGNRNATAGAVSDITHATRNLSCAIQECGMTGETMRYSINTEMPGVIHDVSEIEQIVRIHLKKAYHLARRLIRHERRLLLEVANYLSDHPAMSAEMFRDYFYRFATPAGIDRHNNQKTSYRAGLLEAVTNARCEDSRPEKKLFLIKGHPEKASAA